MPSKNTRVALTLPDEVIAVLDRMGSLTGAGRATLIRQWLIDGLPMFEELADAMQMATEQNIDAFKVMADTLAEASGGFDGMAGDLRKRHRAAMRKRSHPTGKARQ